MRIFVAITDQDWFELHASRSQVDEVNFWRPSPNANFKALQPGELLLFKLHAPLNFIAGGGFFTRFLHLPLSLAWDSFGEANGVISAEEMSRRIGKYRHIEFSPNDNPNVGCIMLAEPFFWPKELWIPSPPEFSRHNQVGQGFDAESGVGKALWAAVSERLAAQPPPHIDSATATLAAIESNGYGKPQIIHPRLGQGSFRVLVTDAYERRCSITGERTLPVLDTAHIMPFSVCQRHELSNGILMRSDLHRLFDGGYLTIDPVDRKVIVSKRIRQEFENGKEYYQLEGKPIREPSNPAFRALTANIEFHAYNRFS
jgi:putative restriction endonuclease